MYAIIAPIGQKQVWNRVRNLIVTPEEISCACEGDLPRWLASGLELFNQGEYFEAHEELERPGAPRPGRCASCTAAFCRSRWPIYHILRGNYRGAVKMFLRSRTWLDPFPGPLPRD